MITQFQAGLNSILLEELRSYENAKKVITRMSIFSGMFIELLDFGGYGLSCRSEFPAQFDESCYRAARKLIIQQLFSNIYDRSQKSRTVNGQLFAAKLIFRDSVPVAVGIVVCPLKQNADDASELLIQLGNFCRYIYTGYSTEKSADAHFSDVLSYLLFDTAPDISTIVAALLPSYKQRPSLAPPYISLNFLSKSGSPEQLKKACQHFSADLPNTYRVVRKNEVLAILCNFDVSKTDETRKKWDYLSKFCKKYSLSCGCSMPFYDIADREIYNQQAQTVNRLGLSLDQSGDIYRADILLPELMAETAARYDSNGSMILSEILILSKYDTENSSEYLHTMETYLINERSMTHTAAALFIDRSTLKYRLNKIQAMTGFDFSDSLRCASLLMSCRIYRSHMRQNAT